MTLQNKKTNEKNRGFTIVELLIVIVVIAILAAITLVAYNGVTARAKTAASQSAAQSVQTKSEAYNAENNGYPTTLNALTNTTTAAGTDYQLTGVTLSPSQALSTPAAMTGAPSAPSVVDFYTCTTGGVAAGNAIGYWNYSSTPAALNYVYTGSTTGGSLTALPTGSGNSTCTLTAS